MPDQHRRDCGGERDAVFDPALLEVGDRDVHEHGDQHEPEHLLLVRVVDE